MLDKISDRWIPNLDPAEYAGSEGTLRMRGTMRPSDYGEPGDEDDYDRLTARTRREQEVECRECGREEVYSRGWCRNCYDRWLYRRNHARIRANQKKYKDRKRKERIDASNKGTI